MVAVAGIAVLVGPTREQEVKDAIARALEVHRTGRRLPGPEPIPLPDRVHVTGGVRMSYFAVIRQEGCAWTDGGITAQPATGDIATIEPRTVFVGAQHMSTAHAPAGTAA
jgi:hypothetical protein